MTSMGRNMNKADPFSLSVQDKREIQEFDYLMHDIAAESQKDFNMVRDFSDRETGIWSIEQNAVIDPMTLKALFYDEDWIFIAVDLCALKISKQRMKVYKKTKSETGKEIIEEVPQHRLNRLLEMPNPYQDYHAFMYSIVVDNIVGGNDIIWKGLLSEQLYLIPFETVTPKLSGNNDELLGFDKIAWDQFGVANKIGFFPRDQIIHIKRPNPSCIYWGLSPLIPGRRATLFNRFSSQYLINYYLKGAAPGIVLEMQNEVNLEKTNRLIRSFEQAYTGRKNQRRTMILPPGVTAKNPMHTLADQQLKDYVTINKETILNLLHIPKHEVSMQTSGSLGSEEYATALRNFWSSTLIPTQKMISGEFTRSFKDQLEPNEFFDFDNGDVEILKENEINKAKIAEALLATHSINEVRQKIYQIEPKEGYDDIGKPVQQAMPFAGFSLPNTDKVEKVVVEGEFVEDPYADTDQQDNPDDEIASENLAIADKFIKASGNWFSDHQREINQSVEKPTQNLTDFLLKMFADQAIDIIKELPKILGTKGLKPRKIKDSDQINKLTDAEFAAAQKRINQISQRYRTSYVKKTKDELAPVVEAGYGIATKVPANLPIDKITALGVETKKKRNAMLEARSIDAFEYLIDTTSKQVMATIAKGVGENLTIDQIAKNIAGAYADSVDKTLWRATRIARTESLVASSIGQAAAMNNAAKVVPNLKKIWLSTNDLRTRGNPDGLYPKSKSDHWGMHGQVRNVDEDFVDPRNGAKLAWPRDLKGGASDVINCRCTWAMLPADEMNNFITQGEAQPNA